MKHAHVKIDGMEIPLIGIAQEETQEKCIRCGKPSHLQETRLDWKGNPVCRKCWDDGWWGFGY